MHLLFRSRIIQGTGWRTVITTVFIVFTFARGTQGQTAKLVPADNVRMLRCEASSVPAFRFQFNIVDPTGAPIALPLPPDKELANSLRILVDRQELIPFFAAASGVAKQSAHGRTVLILIDVSGSMNKRLATGETRFEAAKGAIQEFLQGFQSGSDRVAIVPFESHRVRERIDSATFAVSAAEAQRQVQALPVPEGRNNTALYSAVDLGLDKLENQLKGGSSPSQFQLIVVTDGENDVGHPGDDPGLLTGDQGLQTVVEKVQAYSQIQVTAIGFGDAREVDEEALKTISNKYRMVNDAEGLKRVFASPSAPPVSEGLRATVSSPWSDRAWLAARTLHLRALLQLPTGERIESDQFTWSTPQIGLPLFEGTCDASEEKALLESGRAAATVGWASILRPVLVFVGLGVALLLLWFWVPHLVWPEGYMSGVQARRDARWTPATVAVQGAAPAVRRRAPPGFQQTQEGARAPQRFPADPTRVLPANMMGTRTRLELRKPKDDER